jgi:hypothetical protein
MACTNVPQQSACCAAMRALYLCSRNIHGEYLAQFTRGSVTVSRQAKRQRELVMTASREVHVLRVVSPAIRHRARRPGKHKFHTLGCESVLPLVPLASFVLFALLLGRLSHRLLGSFSPPIQSAILTSRIFQAAQERRSGQPRWATVWRRIRLPSDQSLLYVEA